MQPLSRRILATGALTCFLAGAAAAQADKPLTVGTVAPDFSLTGATRDSVMKGPVRLSDFKGQTVVLAFFYKARSSG